MTNDEAIEVINRENDPNDKKVWELFPEYREALDMAIKAIEQTTWIPVSERLPKKSGKYWCTFGGTNLTGSDYYTTESDAKEIFDDAAEEHVGWESQNVIAWMPLPQSYKGE